MTFTAKEYGMLHRATAYAFHFAKPILTPAESKEWLKLIAKVRKLSQGKKR